MTERRRAPSELAVPRVFSHVVVGRTELLARTSVRPELLARIERAGLVRALGQSPTEAYYAREALDQVERVQTLLGAGYAERDVAHVVGKVSATRAGALVRVLELDLERPELRTLADAGLIPLWAVTDAGQSLIHAVDQPLCEALAALSVVGLDELAPALAEVGTGSSGSFAELSAAIDTRLTALSDAAARLRKALAQLKRRARVRPVKLR